MTWNTHANWIAWNIMRGCSHYTEKIIGIESYDYPYYENGRSWTIRFVGLNEDVPPLEIIDSSDSPLQGGNVTLETTIV
jgi:hypothetical protein